MSKKRILVAGGAGFIGSHLCEYLLDRGNEVHCIDNLITGRKKNIQHLFDKGLNWFDSDIIAPHPLNQPYEEIYNLASPASPVDFEKMPAFILKTGSIGQLQLLEWAREWDSRILFASTSEVYGDPLEHPQKESYLGNVNSIGIRGCYDEAKRFGEAITMAYLRQYKIKTRIARIFNTYGSRMRPEDGRIIPNFFSQAFRKESLTIYGEGRQTRSFCYVSDMVEGLVALMNSDVTTPVNIGNPVEKSVLEMADSVNEITGNKKPHKFLPLPEGDPQRRRPDITKAKELLKWSPKVDLKGGLAKTMDYFKSEIGH